MGDRVQARYYSNNKAGWKIGKIIKKLGQLHYLVKLDCGYVFKRHIDQLYKTDVKTNRKSVSFAPGLEYEVSQPSSIQPKTQIQLGDLVIFPTIESSDNSENVQTSSSDSSSASIALRRPIRNRRPPSYLQDYVLS